MEDINAITLNAINNYYNYLDNLGYISNEETNRILVLITISKVLEKFIMYITDEDLNTIYKVMTCLSKSCLIDNIQFRQLESIFNESNYNSQKELRISESSIQRISEDEVLRSVDMKQ